MMGNTEDPFDRALAAKEKELKASIITLVIMVTILAVRFVFVINTILAIFDGDLTRALVNGILLVGVTGNLYQRGDKRL